MRVAVTIAAAAAFLGIAAGSSVADVQVLAKAGVWQAFGGTTNSGRGVCGVSSSGSGRYISVKYFKGESTLTVQLGSSEWTVNDDAKVKVAFQFDSNSPWEAVGTGMHFSDGDAGLEFDIRRSQLEDFMKEFRAAGRIVIRFPDDDVATWYASLEGTDTVSDNFAKCVRSLGA